MFARSSLRMLSACCAFVALVACTADPLDPLLPYGLVVTNNRNDFSLHATAVKGVMATTTYYWYNDGSKAIFTHSVESTGSGRIIMTVSDADSSQVLRMGLQPMRTDTTRSGAYGYWKIVLDMQNYSGNINISARKR